MRRVLAVSAALGALAASVTAFAQQVSPPGPATAPATPGDWVYSISLQGTPHYQQGFTHFDYVNVNAPKGGAAKLSSFSQTFDTLNPILPKGVPADGIGLVYEELMTGSLDEQDISARYPELADKLRFPADYSSVTFHMNPNKAKWLDGQPVTAEDVVWTFNKLKELNPSQANYYKHVTKAAVTGDGEVTFSFDEAGNRELPEIVSEITVLPQHWWEGKDASGKQRDIGSGTLEPLMGSGPYTISDVIPGRSITYTRNKNYWAVDLPINIGANNFDTISYQYYRDLDVEFEAFKAGEFDYWEENKAARWATAYDWPAFKEGKVIKELVTLEKVSGSMVGFILNTRRPLFQDVRVRRALNYAYDFEQLSTDLFYGQYQRINSYYFGLPFAAKGLPMGQELDILNTVKGEVPPEVFTTEYKNPVGGDPQKVRDNLRTAIDLFTQAGYKLQGTQMLDPKGKPVSFEILLNGNTVEAAVLPFTQALAKIGITATLREADANQFVTRIRSRDFDVVYNGWGQSNSPGNEQLDFWGSAAADSDSSRNYAGIKNPAVDTIINRIIYSKDRNEQLAAAAALDRVLLWNAYVVPSYALLPDRIAYWNKFGHPDPYPKFDEGFPSVWWYDAAKAAKL